MAQEFTCKNVLINLFARRRELNAKGTSPRRARTFASVWTATQLKLPWPLLCAASWHYRRVCSAWLSTHSSRTAASGGSLQ